MEKDYYDILSVPRDCSQEDIKKAFRAKAVKYHPDRNQKNPEAEKKFREAAAAYEVLSNPEKRKAYNQFGHAGVNSQFGKAGFSDIQDIFSSFRDIFEGGDFFSSSSRGGIFDHPFTSSRRSPASQPGADVSYHLSISLLEALKGVEKTLSYTIDRHCSACKGSGAKANSGKKTCSECKGSGRLTRRQGFFAFSSACPSCQGEGHVIESPCSRCWGTGRKKSKEKISLKIPAGIDTGQQLRLSQKGESGYRGGAAGDLYVTIQVKPNKHLKRQGLDLIGNITISYLQALLGAKVQAETLEGKQELIIPAGTQPGELIEIKQAGFPDLYGGRKGGLKYQIHVQFPEKIKKKEKEYLQEIAQLKGENILKS